MLKELCCTAMLLTAGANLYAQEPQSIEKSQTIVYINGAKYYVHNVRHGETLYSLAKTYGVAEQVIAAENPQLAQGLKADQSLKIPVVETGVVVQEQLSPKKLKKTFDQHTVQKGETLYGISKRYAISVETIMEDNPGLDPIHLKPGSVILIRKKAVGKTDEAENTAAWEQYKDRLNLVAEEGYMYHIVAPGATMYALSRRFGTTVENLERLNGISAQDLRSGSMLKVPGDAKSATEPAPEERFGQPEPTESDTLTTVEPQVKEVDFLALSSGEPLRVALLLPMTDGDKQNPNYLDFYQGFLLGLEKIKTQYGYSVRVDLFNTRQESDRLRTIVDDADFRAARLIVGPVYEEELPAVIGYAEEYAVPVVSPLADVKNVDSDVLFQMAPPQMRKYAKIEELTQGEHKQVTLIYGEKNDREFEREILAALQGVPYARHNYRYAVKEGDQGLSSLLANGKDNLLIVLSDSGLEVDRILAAIASANTNLVARGKTPPRFTIVGNSRWNRFGNLDRALYFKDRLVLFSTYHAKRDAEVIKTFDSDYIKAFGALPSLYSYRGYDAAMIFVPAMYSDIQYDMEGRRYTPLQTSYTFQQMPGGSNHVNQNWMRVSYRPDFTITVD